MVDRTASSPAAPWPAVGEPLPELPQLRRPDGRAFRVLLADDNPVNREVGVALLEELGLEVHTAVNGIDAVTQALASPFDAVLMDMQMPVLDGLDATRRIRQLAPHSDIVVIAMTSSAFDRNRQACLDAGMDDFLSKPVDLWQLALALQRWLKA
jgi:CheY-like chemotaxis protein